MTSNFRTRLAAGEPLIGTLLSLPAPELAEIAAQAGFDWLFLDMEHGNLDPLSIVRMVQAAGDACACVVRVPENSEMWIKKALDSGAAGVIIPRVNTRDEAARLIHWARFPPEGGRSVGFTRANRYGASFQEHVETANAGIAVIPQVEHIEGVRNIELMISVPGIDAVFIGPYDLSASLGKPGAVQDPEVRQAMAAVHTACVRQRVAIGVFSSDIPGAAKALAEGYTLVCAGIDIALFARAAGEIVRSLKPGN